MRKYLVLKNDARINVLGHYRQKNIVFKSKASKKFDMEDEEQAGEYFYWKDTFHFIRDITANMKGSDYDDTL